MGSLPLMTTFTAPFPRLPARVGLGLLQGSKFLSLPTMVRLGIESIARGKSSCWKTKARFTMSSTKKKCSFSKNMASHTKSKKPIPSHLFRSCKMAKTARRLKMSLSTSIRPRELTRINSRWQECPKTVWVCATNGNTSHISTKIICPIGPPTLRNAATSTSFPTATKTAKFSDGTRGFLRSFGTKV